jgi:mRNA interferase HicA
MNASELRRWLRKQGCTFETHKGGSGHLTVRRGNRKSQLPMHGGDKELEHYLAN